MAPLVSCVVIAYNYEAYIQRAVNSVLAQSGIPVGSLEVIVVDDGSTDATPELLSAYGDAITVVRQANQGPAVATDRGIAEARGEVIAFLDADDEWTPDHLQRALAVLARRPAVGLVHGDMEVIDADGKVRHPSMFSWSGLRVDDGSVLAPFLTENQATTSAIVLRTEVARQLPPAPAWAWCRDWWIAAHVAAGHEIAVLDAPISRYRLHGSNNFAFGADDEERVLRLQERALRMRRILMRTLDLAGASVPELAQVYNYQLTAAARVAAARGQTLADVLPTDDALRREAAERLAEARERFDEDPAGASRLAVAALAADPGQPAAQELLQRGVAHAQAVARQHRLAGLLVGARSAAAAAAGLDDLAQLRAAWQSLEQERTSGATPADRETLAPSAAERGQALDAVAAGMQAADAGDHRQAALHFLRALALDPLDAHARSRLHEALARLEGRPAAGRDTAARAALSGPGAGVLDGARAFVAVASADELRADPMLLRGWAACFDGHDAATLAIYAPDADPEAAQAAALEVLAAAGLSGDDDRDLMLVAAPRSDALEVALAHEAHARLSRREADRALAALVPTADPARLRALAERRWSHDGLGRALRVAIKICAPRWQGAESWGDLYFARAIADELRRRGHAALIQVIEEWDDADGRECDVALHLRGLDAYVPRSGQLNLLWCISHPELVSAAECDRYDVAFSASARHANELSARTRRPVAVLPQATDPAVFFPEYDPRHDRELVFVGNSRGVFRPIVRDLLPTERDLAIWGQGWEPFVPAHHLAGALLPNHEVRRAYTSATAVLGDHWEDMRQWGIVSNRAYDVLASGGMLISDDLPELHEQLAGSVATYRSPAELQALVTRSVQDPGARAELVARGRAIVLERHTFARRVDTLLAAVGEAIAGPVGAAAQAA